VKRLFEVAHMNAIGSFVDIGDIVANSETGARFGMSFAWVVVVGVVGICLYAEMAGRVATVSGRAVFDLVRERLGARVALVNLLASFFITFLTLAAEIGGVALAIELATSVNYLLWVPIVAIPGVAGRLAGEVQADGERLRSGGALMAGATLFLEPRGIEPGHLSQVALPTLLVLGKLGLGAAARLRRRHLRGGAGDGPILWLHDRPVLRLPVGQVRAARRGAPVPPGRAGLDRARWWAGADHP